MHSGCIDAARGRGRDLGQDTGRLNPCPIASPVSSTKLLLQVAVSFNSNRITVDRMTTSIETNAARQRLTAGGMSGEDLAWLDRHGWSDADIPPPSMDEIEAYERREGKLNSVIAGLGFSERGQSLEGKLAAAIGARLADLRDRGEEDE